VQVMYWSVLNLPTPIQDMRQFLADSFQSEQVVLGSEQITLASKADSLCREQVVLGCERIRLASKADLRCSERVTTELKHYSILYVRSKRNFEHIKNSALHDQLKPKQVLQLNKAVVNEGVQVRTHGARSCEHLFKIRGNSRQIRFEANRLYSRASKLRLRQKLTCFAENTPVRAI